MVCVCADFNQHTCIVIGRRKKAVKYIPFDATGFRIARRTPEIFDADFTPIKYPVKKACEIYLSYAKLLGATKPALECLSALHQNPNVEEFEMPEKETATTTTKQQKPPVKTTKTAGKNTKSKSTTAAAPKKVSGKTEKRETAAQMFQSLIMDGKMTDDQIFKKVQDKFGLDEKKRGYVGWYRNHLKKLGQKPPAPKTK